MTADGDALSWVERWTNSASKLSIILLLIDEEAYLTTSQFIQLGEEFFLSRTAVKYLDSAIFELINSTISLSKRPNSQSSDTTTRYACEVKLVDNGQTKSIMIPNDTALLAICRFAHELAINHRRTADRDTVPYSEPDLYREFMKQFDILKKEGPSREIRSLSSCLYALNLAAYPFMSNSYQPGQPISHYTCSCNHSQDTAQDRALSSLEGKAAPYDDNQHSTVRRKEFPGRSVDPIVVQNGASMNRRYPVASRSPTAHGWQGSRVSNQRQLDNHPSNDRHQHVQMRDSQNWRSERQSERYERSNNGQPIV